MTSAIVVGLKTFIGTNCINRVQDMENGYKTMKENNAQFSVSGEVLFLRYLIEYDTYLAIGGQPDNKIIPPIEHFAGDVDIISEVLDLQQKRYKILCWNWEIQPPTIWQEVGFTKDESKMIYEVAKKKHQYKEFWEEAVLPYYTEKNMIISSDGALNCCYFHMTNYYLNQFPGTPWTTYSFWPDEERRKMSYQIYETYIRPTISIRKEREVNLSIWDMHWNGGQQEENRLCQVMLAAKWEIDNDKYLTFQDNGGKPDPTSITLIRSTGALNLQHAILTFYYMDPLFELSVKRIAD